MTHLAKEQPQFLILHFGHWVIIGTRAPFVTTFITRSQWSTASNLHTFVTIPYLCTFAINIWTFYTFLQEDLLVVQM